MRVIPKLLQLYFIVFVTSINAQQLPNEGFENWDSTGFMNEVPINWLIAQSYISLPCYPFIFTTDKTSDAYSGNWAAKLETKYCEEDGGTPKAYTGFLACGDYTSYPNLPYGVTFNERPAYLNFYCKFLRAGSDTGYASVRLITIDSTGNLDQIIANGSIDIPNNINVYSLISFPLNYYSGLYPNVIQVLFSTSKTIAVANMLAATPPGNGASLGTILWIDDVYLTGGSMNNDEKEQRHSMIFPNPANEKLFINSSAKILSFKIQDVTGREQSFEKINYETSELDIHSLSNGIYFLQVETEKGIFTKRFIKE